MSKVTFVVDYEDGKEPAVHAGMVIFGGRLTAVSWSDSLKDKSFSVNDCLPSPNDTVLIFDANGEGWLIGWRSMWMAWQAAPVELVETLESRTVTVKLPLAVSVGGQGYREQVVDILATVGIQVIEGEGQ